MLLIPYIQPSLRKLAMYMHCNTDYTYNHYNV